MTALGGIAVSVPRLRFGAMTTNVIYRNPAVIAKQAATIDQAAAATDHGRGERAADAPDCRRAG